MDFQLGFNQTPRGLMRFVVLIHTKDGNIRGAVVKSYFHLLMTRAVAVM